MKSKTKVDVANTERGAIAGQRDINSYDIKLRQNFKLVSNLCTLTCKKQGFINDQTNTLAALQLNIK